MSRKGSPRTGIAATGTGMSALPAQMVLQLDTPADAGPAASPEPAGAAGATPPALPLSGLDLAFARFLQERQPSDQAHHALLAALVSHQFGRGHACLDLDLLDQGVAVLGWDASFGSLLPCGCSRAAQSLPWIHGAASPLVLEGNRLYLRRSWEAEQSIRAAITARLQQPVAVDDRLCALLDQLFPPSTLPGTDAALLPDWQKVACALAARSRFTLITGGPGTGKTTTVVRLLALLQALATPVDAAAAGQPVPSLQRDTVRPLRVCLAAPTGKAAARLSESIASAIAQLPPALRPRVGEPAQTLHKLLQVRPDRPELAPPQLAVDLVIVDEASMIDLEMMARLLQAVPATASLVLLGDKDQLASVEAGAVMAQLCQGAEAGRYRAATVAWLQQVARADVRPWAEEASRPSQGSSALAQQTVMLRHSRRFQDDSGIGIWAKAVNAGDVAAVRRLWQQLPAHGSDAAAPAAVDRLQLQRVQDAAFATLLRQGWQPWLAQLQRLQDQACSDAQALAALQAFAGFQVLCALREGPWGVSALNLRIAAALGLPEAGWYAGRPVMVSRNDYHLGLMNGDVGLCLPHARGLRVAFANGQGGVRWVLPSRLDAVESVFAMTVHKSQGSEFAHVCLVLPHGPMPVLTRELLYTGITRAKSRLTLVLAQTEVLLHAVQARVVRSGGLGAGNLSNTP